MSRPCETKFTADEEAAIRAGAESGLSYSQVAESMGRTRSMIAGKAQRMGVTFPRKQNEYSDGEEAAIRIGAAAGLSIREVAAGLVGRSKESVAGRARTMGVSFAIDKTAKRLRAIATRRGKADDQRGIGT